MAVPLSRPWETKRKATVDPNPSCRAAELLERLEAYRECTGTTWKEVAASCGPDESVFLAWRTGKRVPSDCTPFRVAWRDDRSGLLAAAAKSVTSFPLYGTTVLCRNGWEYQPLQEASWRSPQADLRKNGLRGKKHIRAE